MAGATSLMFVYSLDYARTRLANDNKNANSSPTSETILTNVRVLAIDQTVEEKNGQRVVVVQRVITKRVGAPVAAECYIDNSPPPPPREEAVPVAVRDRGAGRPTKRERRSIERLLGRPAR